MILVALFLACASDSHGATRVADSTAPPVLPELLPAVRRQEVEAHVRFLASDELAGRVTGTPECDRAAAYLAAVLAVQGARPAGDGDSYLQAVALERTRLTAPARLALVAADGARTDLAPGTDFDAPARAVAADALRLVVVRSAAELPKTADAGVALFVDGSTKERRTWFEGAGLGDGSGFGAVLVPGSKKAGRARDHVATPGTYRRAKSPDSRRAEVVVRVHGPALDRLRTAPPATIALTISAEIEHATSSNVVARIPGRAPRDGRERAVVISAHYDHIAHGHGPAKGTDTIYNGADDDASGVAAVLEIAGALGSGGELAHDVVVLLATGEEIGLLGTEHYLDAPVVPLERTIANLNFEMIGRPDAKVGGRGNLWLTGDDKTNLGALLRERGFRIAADPRPDQHFYERSDNYAFVLRGVIGQTLSSYDMHTDYHAPSDEADKIDFEHLTGATEVGLKAVRLLAGGEVEITWTAGRPPVAPR